MPFLLDTRKRRAILQGHTPGHLYNAETLKAWDTYDTYCRMQEEVRLPTLTVKNENPIDLERLKTRINYSKTIIAATATMALSGGWKIKDSSGARDEKAERLFKRGDLRRLVDHMSRYGAGWFHIVHDNPFKPYRIHKPHLAREIYDDGDNEVPRAVLFMEEYKDIPSDIQTAADVYWMARIYEWEDDFKRVRMYEYRKHISGGPGGLGQSDWTVTSRTPEDAPMYFSYMPMRFCINHPEVDRDRLEEASDLFTGIPVFQSYNEIVTKLNKALEDEAFRQTFFAGVSEKGVKAMTANGPTTFLYYYDGDPTRPLPQMQVAPPSDVRQFIEVMNRLIKSIATVTRTAPPELDERPVQDIPAQTLRVLYNPQIERVGDTVEVLREALAETAQIIKSGGQLDKKAPWTTDMNPEVPMSADKRAQEDQGYYNSNAMSAVELLIRTKGYTEQEAKKIVADRLEEDRERLQMETDVQKSLDLELEEKKGANGIALEQERRITQSEAPAPTGGFGG